MVMQSVASQLRSEAYSSSRKQVVDRVVLARTSGSCTAVAVCALAIRLGFRVFSARTCCKVSERAYWVGLAFQKTKSLALLHARRQREFVNLYLNYKSSVGRFALLSLPVSAC